MPKRYYKSLPDGYPVCQFLDCLAAATCLHQQFYKDAVQKYDTIRLVNPERCVKDASCPFYRDSKPVPYALGFMNFQQNMFPEQYDRFKKICTDRWGRSSFFERRRGTFPLSPADQEFAREALKTVGVTAELDFDAYEPFTNWYD